MARNENVTVPAETWTQLTNANASAVRVSNLSGFRIELQATSDTTAPTVLDGTVPLDSGLTLNGDVTLASLYPGVTTPVRLWAFCRFAVEVSVSHADA